jgi:hypothetical protein
MSISGGRPLVETVGVGMLATADTVGGLAVELTRAADTDANA